MREIKFRGMRMRGTKGCMIYGDLRNSQGDFYIYPIDSRSAYEVKPETIGQYTGLKDQNGKEIYEGDIILWRNQKYVVKIQSGMFYASVEEFNKDVYGGFPLWSLVEYHDEPDCGVIVGNIYEYKEEEK